ncbi:MAG: class I SAM-dependent methyltransferase [Candidatus Aenigmatarchaeota archaeon]
MKLKGQDWYQKSNVASRYDKRFRNGGRVLDHREREILEEIVEPGGRKILDIATGTGRFAESMVRSGGEVTGLDASREMLQKGKAEYMVGDALCLPFSDKTFDVTTAMRFFHLLEWDQILDFIREVSRVTKDRFVFDTLSPASLRLLYQRFLPQKSHLHSTEKLKELFEAIPEVKDVEMRYEFIIPYGLYQVLPFSLARELMPWDVKTSNKIKPLASTVYWELYF